jgi:predicted GNAT family acetyltransferase
MPGAAEVGEIIFKIKAGGKDGLELLGFQVDTQESCAMAMETVWIMVQRCFTSDQINEMGLDPTTLEHALCKFKRMYAQCIANVS